MKPGKRFILYSLLVIFTVVWLFPIYLMFKISTSEPQEVLTQHPTILPHSFTTEHWENVIESGNVGGPLRKSFTVAVLTAVLSLLIAIPGAYVLAKIPGNLGYYIIIFIFFTRMIPEVGIALPITVSFAKLGLFDTDMGLVLAHLIRALPIVTWVLIGTYKTIPKSLEEASYVDGNGKMKTLIKVIIPLARPGIVVGVIFAWLLSWEEFIYASYLSLANKTLPLEVFYYIDRGGWFNSSTFAAIITVPMLFITYYFQKYIMSGYLSGGVKG
jgi:trehalose transport system permease protein